MKDSSSIEDVDQIVKWAKVAVRSCIKRYGFKAEKGLLVRTKEEVNQFVGFTQSRVRSDNEVRLDLQILICSPTLYERIYEVPSTGIWNAQISTILSFLCGRKSPWSIATEAEASISVPEVCKAFEDVALKIFDSTISHEEIVKAALLPQMIQKSYPLAEWEAKVFRGEATLEERPRLNLGPDRDFFSTENMKYLASHGVDTTAMEIHKKNLLRKNLNG